MAVDGSGNAYIKETVGLARFLKVPAADLLLRGTARFAVNGGRRLDSACDLGLPILDGGNGDD